MTTIFRMQILYTGIAAGALLASGVMVESATGQNRPGAQTPGAQTQAGQPSQQQQQQQQVQRQQTQPGPQQPAQQQVAQKCLDDLQTLNSRMQEDGYWLTGWGSRWGTPAQPGTTGAAPTARPPTATTSPRTEAAAPWGTQARFGMQSPRYQIRILHAAANVLAHRGDQEACAIVVAELRDLYTGYVQELRQAGVEPGGVTTWRQERIVAAKPFEQLEAPISVDDVTGTELRNAQDERLGSIHDVVVSPQTGEISHVIVARGGFLGFGKDYVVVPWQNLRATPDLNMFVLNVSEQVMEQAPTVDADRIGDRTVYQQQRQEAEQYWKQHTAG